MKKLKRLVLANMLWEDQFYVDGESTAKAISKEVANCTDPKAFKSLMVDARHKFNLRHVPLLLATEGVKPENKYKLVDSDTVAEIISRPDELSELLAIYWKDGRKPVSNVLKRGMAKAFTKFSEYQLAKWDKNSAAISLRDVMFLTHPKPSNPQQAELFKRLAENDLKTPDTWETALSGGANKKETFTRLLSEKKLGALAFIRNLRNMSEAGVDVTLIKSYAKTVSTDKVLPFRFVAAVKQVPQFSEMLEEMMLRSLKEHPKIPGKTILLVDVSGSMWHGSVSAKSDLVRFDAAAALCMLCREVCESFEVFTFSDQLVKINAPKCGFALIEQLEASQAHSGTDTKHAVDEINKHYKDASRILLFTDEQSNTGISPPSCGNGYVINVAGYANNRIDHKAWTEITGFSEAVLDYIRLSEEVIQY